ncbi:putative B3 domain-containing protein At4g03160 [Durio zibethinus]|uniref:B3 domain-containing protein At4g03160 n=1 Tax=Durio zibethinus TaxID=66656 RepID=A0A6P5XXZ3_DURZI|nr:putative B3 domain-containing protein At4g03160 [Durio zibethinus]
MAELKGIESPEEYKEICWAALCVASLKHEKLSSENALALHGMKTKFARQIRARRDKPKAQKESDNLTEERVNAQNLPGTPNLFLPLSSYFPPDIPSVPCLNGLIGRCSKPFEKQLTESDVKVSQCRLSINKIDVAHAVMPLLKEEEDSSEGIPVKVYDADGKEYPMTFITWSFKLHVLKEGWINFCNDHSLLAHQDFVTLWVFRNLQTDDLCFVITSRRLEVFEAIKRRRLK